eukprot:TRINITY_DN3497_c0_g1_i1.p1 TRINITY_DN3497_c0_g1~~TRINITY_DN3497_c0_g1_i1.p1  ORF type:complete len:1044 (+),score=225.95 TRINITY_DN3497_c0_g1_i1:87-3218(+)
MGPPDRDKRGRRDSTPPAAALPGGGGGDPAASPAAGPAASRSSPREEMLDYAVAPVGDTEVAYNAPRKGCCGCTDCPCLLLLVAVMTLFGALSYIAYDKGNPLRLMRGTDYLGNICGQTGSRSAPREPSPERLAAGSTWSDYDHLWYPFDPTRPDLYDDATDLGVCVRRCPADGDAVYTYGGAAEAAAYTVQYDSQAELGRCLPLRDGNMSDARERFDATSKVRDGVAQLRLAWQTICVAMGVAVGIAVLWLVLLSIFATPIVFFSILAIIATAAGGGVMLWLHGKSLRDEGDDEHKWVGAVAIVLFCVAGLVLLMTPFMIKRVCLGTATQGIVENASRVMLTVPSLFAVPSIITVLLFAWLASCVYTVLAVQTMEDHNLHDIGFAGQNVTAYVRKVPYSRTGFQIYTVVCFFWGSVFLQDLCYLIVAETTAFWFFSGGESKRPPCFSPLHATVSAIRHHLGTVAFGSLVIAICKPVRWPLMRLRAQFEAGAGDPLCCVRCIAQCLLACIERCIQFLAESAYLVTAIEGSSFCAAAKRAVELIARDPPLVQDIALVSGIRTFLGKLLVVSGTVVWAYLALEHWGISAQVSTYWVPLLVTGVLAWMISSVIVDLISVTIEALTFCHFVDDDRFGGVHRAEQQRAQLQILAARRRVGEQQAALQRRKAGLERDLAAVESLLCGEADADAAAALKARLEELQELAKRLEQEMEQVSAEDKRLAAEEKAMRRKRGKLQTKQAEMPGLRCPAHWTCGLKAGQGWRAVPVPPSPLFDALAASIVPDSHLFKPSGTDYVERGSHSRLILQHAWRIENPTQWEKYVLGRGEVESAIATKRLPVGPRIGVRRALAETLGPGRSLLPEPLHHPGGVNECRLFHGTSPLNLLAILSDGFNGLLAGSARGTAFGCGTYLAEDAGKSDQYVSSHSVGRRADLADLERRLYAGGAPRGKVYYIIVCRVTCGCAAVTNNGWEDLSGRWLWAHAETGDRRAGQPDPRRELDRTPGSAPDRARYSSLLVEKDTGHARYREVVMFNSQLIYPEYVLAYERH